MQSIDAMQPHPVCMFTFSMKVTSAELAFIYDIVFESALSLAFQPTIYEISL